MSFEIPRESFPAKIRTVEIDATADDGGTRSGTVTLGGVSTLPFHSFEGEMPNPPVIAMEVFDTPPKRYLRTLLDYFGDVVAKPGAMAKKCVEEYGAEMNSLRRDGKFNETLIRDSRSDRYVVAEASDTETGRNIFISQNDIINIMRAKAAIFSACTLLTKNIGISIDDIDRIYVAGGFGSRLNFDKAITIGLFPDMGTDKCEYLGNTSLQGAYLALLSAQHRTDLSQIANNLTYIDLSTESDYMNQYTGALFLPHTDVNLFPSVRGMLRATARARESSPQFE